MISGAKQHVNGILMITFHFPPYQGSSGFLRTLKFVQYLPEFDIEPVVLTAHPRAYERLTTAASSFPVPGNLTVKRSFALDTKQHLSCRGRYFEVMASPDRYISWIPGAVFNGVRLVTSKKTNVIFSTSPVASAHLIGYYLTKITRKPWIADFRDPMWDDYSPFSPQKMKTVKIIEALVIENASMVTVTTAGMYNLFLSRYPGINPEKITVITNGYDEADFVDLPILTRGQQEPIVFTHTGLLQQIDRDPTPFFDAIKILKEKKKLDNNDIRVEFYAPGEEAFYQDTIAHRGLDSIIQIHTPIPYRDAIEKMARSDVLLLFQGPSCQDQIPAKAYEYLRTGRPIFAMTPATSETARLIYQTNAGVVVPPDDAEKIARVLLAWIDQIKAGTKLPEADQKLIRTFSRKNQTAELANIVQKLAAT